MPINTAEAEPGGSQEPTVRHLRTVPDELGGASVKQLVGVVPGTGTETDGIPDQHQSFLDGLGQFPSQSHHWGD